MIMLCTEKGFMVQAQYCSEWCGVSYGIARLFDSFVLSRSMIEGTTTSLKLHLIIIESILALSVIQLIWILLSQVLQIQPKLNM